MVEILIVARDLASGKIKDAATDVERSLNRIGSASRRSADDTDASSESQQRLAGEANATDRVLQKLATSIENVNRRLDSLGGSGNRGGGGLRRVARDGDDAWKSLGKLSLVLVGLPTLVYAVGAAGFGASAGIYALGAALSTLSGFAVAIPAALGGIAGALAAVMTIVKPAISGIGAAVQAVDQQRAAAASGGGGGGGAPDHSAEDAERRLKQVRQDNAYSIMQLERELAAARLQGVQRIIDAEQRLHDLKMKDGQQERQLQASLADARASAAGERARGGEHTQLADALVGEAGADLSSFQAQARGQEATAQRDVQRAVQDRNRSVQDVQIRLAHQQVENARALADAQRSVARAQEAAATGAGSPSAVQQAFAKLSPLQRQVANEIIAIKDAWTRLTHGDQVKWLQEILQWLHLIHGALPEIATEVEKFSDALLHVADSGRKAFEDSAFTGAIQRVDTVLARGLENAGESGIHLGKALVFVLDSARPFLRWIEDTVLQWSKYIEQSAKVNDANGDLGRFFEHTRQTGTQVGHIIRDLATGLFNIGKIAFPTGSGLLKGLADLSKRFREFTDSTSGRRSIAGFFAQWTPVFLEMAKLIANIAKDLKNFIQLIGPSPFLIFLEALNRLPEPLRGVTAAIIAMVIASRALRASLVGQAIEAIGEFIISLIGLDGVLITSEGIMLGFGAEVAFISLPMIALVAAIVLVVGGILLLLNHFGLLMPVVHAAGRLFDWLTGVISDFLSWVGEHWKGILLLIGGPLGILIVIVQQNWDKIKNAIFGVVDAIWGKIKDIFGGIVDYFRHGTGAQIADAVGDVFRKVTSILRTVWGDISGTLQTIVNGIIGGINWVLRHIGLASEQIDEWGAPSTHSGGGGGGGGGGGRKAPAPARGGPGIGGLAAFDEGGVVPGPVGAPTIAVVHGGETILPTHKRGVSANPGGAPGGGPPASGGGGIPGLGFIADHLPHIPDLSGTFGALGKMATGALGWMRDKVFDKLVAKGKHWLSSVASVVTGVPGDIIGLFRGGGAPGNELAQAATLGHQVAGHADQGAVNAALKIGALMTKALGFGANDFAALVQLWTGESGWRWWADNPTSDAYGIPQSLPGSKMAAAGADWHNNPFTQILWGLSYIKARYGSPSSAYSTWLSRSPHWYGEGGPVMGGPMGSAIPIIAHVGEWVLNRGQQMRLAAALGGLENARKLLFDSHSMAPTYAFAGGGVVQNWGGATTQSMVRSVYAPVTVYSSKAEYDGDYLASVLERRFAMGG